MGRFNILPHKANALTIFPIAIAVAALTFFAIRDNLKNTPYVVMIPSAVMLFLISIHFLHRCQMSAKNNKEYPYGVLIL